jgi:anti-sigma-K factor RskA
MRLGGEPALRQVVAEWSEGLVTLTGDIAPVAPPEAIKSRIDAQLFPPQPATRRSGFSLRNLILGGMTGLVAALALVVVLPFVTPQAPGAVYQAEISTEGAALVLLASFDARTGRLRVERTAGAPAPGRSLELWLIAPNAPAAVSLGVVDPAVVTLEVPVELRGGFAGGAIGISDEPLGGSTNGLPTTVLGTGPVLLL